MLRRDRTYRSLAYLAVSVALGWVYFLLFGGMIQAGAAGGFLVFLLLMAALLGGSWYAAMFERALAMRLLRVHVPPMAAPVGPHLSVTERMKAHLRNPVTWKALVYLFLRVPFVAVAFLGSAFLLAGSILLLAPVEYLIAISILTSGTGVRNNPLIAPPWGGTDVPLRDLLGISARHGSTLAFDLVVVTCCLFIGLLAVPTVLRLLNGVVALWGRFAALMLGINESALAVAEAQASAARERARAEQADNSRRELILNASHELRTPVASLRAHIESLLLLEGDQISDRVRGFLAITQREAERLTTLVDDLFMLARADADELRLDLRPVDVASVVEEAYQALEPLAEREREVMLVRSVAPDLPDVRADHDRLAQVVLNLVRNAIAYTPQGGVVSIEAGAGQPGWVELRVTDTGIGIPPEDLERVFERFYRGDASRARETGGSGLGLSIVRDLVRAMGGTVVAERVPEGGTRFHLTLRTADEAVAHA